MADPGIDRWGAPIFSKNRIHHRPIYALEGSSPENFRNLRPQMTHSGPFLAETWSFFCFWDLNLGGGGVLDAPLSGFKSMLMSTTSR